MTEQATQEKPTQETPAKKTRAPNKTVSLKDFQALRAQVDNIVNHEEEDQGQETLEAEGVLGDLVKRIELIERAIAIMSHYNGSAGQLKEIGWPVEKLFRVSKNDMNKYAKR